MREPVRGRAGRAVSRSRASAWDQDTTPQTRFPARARVDKTLGIPQALASALEPIAGRVRLALLYGSVAKGSDTASSDIDVLIVSDHLSLEAAFQIFEPVEARLGRKINPTIYPLDEFVRRRRERQPFLTRVLEGKHQVLIGSVDAA